MSKRNAFVPNLHLNLGDHLINRNSLVSRLVMQPHIFAVERYVQLVISGEKIAS